LIVILPSFAGAEEDFGDAGIGVDNGEMREDVFRRDDLVVVTAGDEIEFCSMRLAYLYQDPVDAAASRRAFSVPDRLALPRLRPDDRRGSRRSGIGLQFDPTLIAVDDTLDIGVAITSVVLDPTEVREMSALPQMLDAIPAPLP
jgi:hypothetical protein